MFGLFWLNIYNPMNYYTLRNTPSVAPMMCTLLIAYHCTELNTLNYNVHYIVHYTVQWTTVYTLHKHKINWLSWPSTLGPLSFLPLVNCCKTLCTNNKFNVQHTLYCVFFTVYCVLCTVCSVLYCFSTHHNILPTLIYTELCTILCT